GEGGGSGQEVRSGGDVAERDGPPAGTRQPLERRGRETLRVGVVTAELAAIEGRALEVVPEQLVVLDARPDHALEPAGEAFVQLGPRSLRRRFVRDLADEEVAEREGRLAGEGGLAGLDQVAAAERGGSSIGSPNAAGERESLCSSSSARASDSTSIGPRAERSTCSTRSMKVGSAQCRSSRTTTSGELRASASRSLRVARKSSS